MRLRFGISIGYFIQLYSPDGFGPGRIVLKPCEYMDMQLRHHITERGGVDFVGVMDFL